MSRSSLLPSDRLDAFSTLTVSTWCACHRKRIANSPSLPLRRPYESTFGTHMNALGRRDLARGMRIVFSDPRDPTSSIVMSVSTSASMVVCSGPGDNAPYSVTPPLPDSTIQSNLSTGVYATDGAIVAISMASHPRRHHRKRVNLCFTRFHYANPGPHLLSFGTYRGKYI